VGRARSSPGSVLFATYNPLDLGAGDPADGAGHYATASSRGVGAGRNRSWTLSLTGS
jgi:hypothetical protein